MPWLAKAGQLPGRALFVALVLWHLAGLQRTRVVAWQPGRAAALGLRRHAVYRGVRALELAGLITVERRLGRAPRITIENAQDRR
jgi:hypothetical protein